MNFSAYFVKRPIFATVLSLMVVIGGLVSMINLPIAEYPDATPPSIVVTASFPGANPTEISNTVATPLEEQINGVEGMLYMSSLANSDGTMTLRVTFEIGTNPDLAQQMVQNRVSQALPRLPEVTRQLGVTVTKSSPDLTMVVNLVSPDDSYDLLYLRNYANLNVKDELAKINGAGQVLLFGSGDYAMRVWLNPDKVAERGMNAEEVIQAIRNQNVQVAGGLIGGPPYEKSVVVQMPVNVQGRLSSIEEFEEIIIKRNESGSITRLKDVARVELDAQTYALRSRLNGKESVGIAIMAAPEANALQISDDVRTVMDELQKTMPSGVAYEIIYDPTVFVQDSIDAVVSTLVQAVLMVALVVIVFLQNWRAAIIPLLAVPVSIIGTFAFMLMFDFSINVLTLFGLILAIGIVVDDAIVVVENVERNIASGKKPKEATIQAMKEVTGPVIATTLVLVAVFVPIAFISGLTGQFYRQFALTIAIAAIISTLNSLTLSPAMAALLLKPKDAPQDLFTRIINFFFGWFFRAFDFLLGRGQKGYSRSLMSITRRKIITMLIFGGLIAMTAYSFSMVPKGFVPTQDKQYLVAIINLPPGATLDRTEAIMKEVDQIVLQEPGTSGSVQYPGLSINGFTNAPNSGLIFVLLDDFEQRRDPDLSAMAIVQKIQAKLNLIEGAFIQIFPPPPVSGLGNVGGFTVQIQDRADRGDEALNEVTQQVMMKAAQDPALANVYSNYNINFPQIYAQVDRTEAELKGVSVQEIFQTMQIYLGSMYINDFNLFGRTYQVIAQADKEYRAQPSDITRLQTRNDRGEMVPLGSMVKIEETFGPDTAMRYNSYRSADINGAANIGYSSGQAQDAITRILDETLPPGMSYEWTGLTYQEKLTGNTAIYIFPLCLLLIFLILAAQYESLAMPLAVILIVPMAILSAMFGLWISGGDNNIFTQIALFVLAGLASKNAILIVEFARELEREGKSITEAAIEASRLRLRPILMTSVSFIAGVMPLVFSHGAGSEMRQAIGIAVFYGMIGVTVFGLIFTPVFYVLMRQIESLLTRNKTKNTEA